MRVYAIVVLTECEQNSIGKNRCGSQPLDQTRDRIAAPYYLVLVYKYWCVQYKVGHSSSQGTRSLSRPMTNLVNVTTIIIIII